MFKKVVCIIISVVLMIYIGFSIQLICIKPDISHMKKGKVIAAFTQPAVVRVTNIVTLTWYFRDNCTEDNNMLSKYDFSTQLVTKGSGFIINPDGYLVTNAQIVKFSKMADSDIVDNKDIISDKDREEAKKDIIQKYANDLDEEPECVLNDLRDKDSKLYIKVVKKEIKVILQSGEALCGEIKSYGNPTSEGKDVAVLKIEKKNLPTVKLGDSDKVQLQDDVWLWGYPTAADCLFLSEKSSLVPVIIPETITSVDKKTEQCVTVFSATSAAIHGSSGGTVIGENGKVIGLLTLDDNSLNNKDVQCFNFIIPANTVKEFIAQSGGKNEQGAVDKLYREGLILYWGGYYKDALDKFEGVQRLLPDHPLVKKYIADSQQKICESKVLWYKYKTIVIITDAAAVVIIITLMVIALKKKKRRRC